MQTIFFGHVTQFANRAVIQQRMKSGKCMVSAQPTFTQGLKKYTINQRHTQNNMPCFGFNKSAAVHKLKDNISLTKNNHNTG